jgi:glycosyltransferase involved in cell wall biosynthesis
MATADREVLIVLASADRRGAELEGMALAEQLRTHGVPASAVALAPGSAALAVPTLGHRPRAPTTLRALRRRARDARVVVAYGSTTLPACAIGLLGSRIPFVYRSIGEPGAWVRGRAHRARTGLLLQRSVHVVALWPGAAESIRRLYDISPEKISVIPNARDHRAFRPPSPAERHAARTALDLQQATTAVTMIGSLTREKRVDLAIEAVSRMPDAQLLVVGDGPAGEALARRAAIHGGTVRLLGRRDDVRPILHAADVILSTSTTEGMPGALIEAALCGVPAVATDVGAVNDVVGDGGVVVSASAGATEVASALAQAGADATRLGDVARQRAAALFSWAAVAPRWASALADLNR